MSLTCLRLGQEVRVGEWSKLVTTAGYKGSQSQRAEQASIFAMEELWRAESRRVM